MNPAEGVRVLLAVQKAEGNSENLRHKSRDRWMAVSTLRVLHCPAPKVLAGLGQVGLNKRGSGTGGHFALDLRGCVP